ncbi:MAG: anti-sigma factor, partial [Ignavibacteriales bacterium]
DLNNELVVHSGLLNLLEKKDTRVFPLYGSDIHPDGFGKIFLNSASNRAYLYISGVPVPPEDARYQLWLINSDNISPIGLFYPKNGTGYFYFTLPDIKSNNIRFLLTEEPTGGSGRPGKKIFLTSSN